MKQYFALVANNKVVALNYEEVPNPLPNGLTVFPMTQSQYENLNRDLMPYYVISNDLIMVDDLAQAKANKIREAIAYKDSVDKFILNAEEYRIDILSLRNLFLDLSIREKDIALNSMNACSETIMGGDYIIGYNGNIDPIVGMNICTQVRCYKRVCDNNLATLIVGIEECETTLDVQNFDITNNYPSIPNISNS